MDKWIVVSWFYVPEYDVSAFRTNGEFVGVGWVPLERGASPVERAGDPVELQVRDEIFHRYHCTL